LHEAHQGIVNLLLRAQDRVLIVDEQLLQLRILQAHVIGDLAVVQDIPLKGGPAARLTTMITPAMRRTANTRNAKASSTPNDESIMYPEQILVLAAVTYGHLP
jgi:hypothetical protein